jgi:glycosyltransferase involved in cell wall biosynthesis
MSITRSSAAGTGTERVRVACLNSGADIGGGEKYMLALADHLDAAVYAHSFVVPYRGAFLDELERRHLDVALVDLRRRVTPAGLLALARHFRRARPHLVHTAGARASFYGRVAARLAGVPAVVSSVHTSIAAYEVSPARKRLYLTLDRVTARLADRIICTSHAITRDVVVHHRVPATRVITIQNRPELGVVRPERGREATRQALGVGPAARLLGVVARLTPQKGVDDLLRALARLGADGPPWACVVVGGGPCFDELTGLAGRLGLSGRVRFVGPRTDLGDLLAAFDVVVVPSVSEGLPYIVLESMAVGLPVVATAVGGIPEVLAHGVRGLLVPPRDPSALAAAVDALRRDPDRARGLGAAARRFITRDFGFDAMVEAVDTVYRSVLNEARARGRLGA